MGDAGVRPARTCWPLCPGLGLEGKGSKTLPGARRVRQRSPVNDFEGQSRVGRLPGPALRSADPMLLSGVSGCTAQSTDLRRRAAHDSIAHPNGPRCVGQIPSPQNRDFGAICGKSIGVAELSFGPRSPRSVQEPSGGSVPRVLRISPHFWCGAHRERGQMWANEAGGHVPQRVPPCLRTQMHRSITYEVI